MTWVGILSTRSAPGARKVPLTGEEAGGVFCSNALLLITFVTGFLVTSVAFCGTGSFGG